MKKYIQRLKERESTILRKDYQEALNWISEGNLITNKPFVELLQELVDKEKAEKGIYKVVNYKILNQENYYICPKCNSHISSLFHNNYCGNCGQKLDWNTK